MRLLSLRCPMVGTTRFADRCLVCAPSIAQMTMMAAGRANGAEAGKRRFDLRAGTVDCSLRVTRAPVDERGILGTLGAKSRVEEVDRANRRVRPSRPDRVRHWA